MATKSKFYELIKDARIEKDVEHVYTTGINLYFPDASIEHPFGCDTFVNGNTSNNKMLKLIIEYKFDEEIDWSIAPSEPHMHNPELIYKKLF